MDAGILERLFTHEKVLDNGLTVLVREDPGSGVVAIVTSVEAGYFDEKDDVVGVSHVLEHMYFKGTARRGPGEIARETKAAGGYLNAGTIYDHTTYYTVLPAGALEQGLDVQSDALANSAIDEDELSSELLVIIQEAKRKLDNPGAVARETLFEVMFDAHRVRRWRIGTEAGLRKLTRKAVWRFYEELYRPENIALVIAGDIDAAHAFDLAERYYGEIPRGDVQRSARPVETRRAAGRFRELSADITQTWVECGWHAPDALHPDSAPLDLLAIVLGQGRASRLYRQVREAGLVTGIGASNYTPGDIGIFTIGAELLPQDTADAIGAIGRVVAGVFSSPCTPAELERARNIVESRLCGRLETADGQANMLADWQRRGDWRLIGTYLDQLAAATPEDLRRVAEQYLRPESGSVLVYRPAGAPALSPDQASLSGRTKRAPAPAAPDPVAVNTVASAPRARSRMAADSVEDGVHFYTTPTGIPIVVKPRPGVGLLSMSIAVPGGALDETVATAGLTSLMTRVSLKGTDTRTAAAHATEIESLGGSISPAVRGDSFDWTLRVPVRHVARGVELLLDVALHPTFPEAEVERERKVALSDMEQLLDDMYRYPLRLFMEAAFPDHAYGLGIDTVEAATRAVTRDDIARWHARHLLDGEPWVFAVGDVDPDRTARAITERLDGIGRGARVDGVVPPAWPPGGAVNAAARDKRQTAMVLGFPGPARNDPDTYRLEVLANVIGGLGGRLFEELRSRRSLAYAVSVHTVARFAGGAFIGYIATSPEREDEARAGLLEELAVVTRTPLLEDEVERAKRYMLGTWKIRMQTNAAQLGELSSALLLGDGLRELREYEDRIRAIGPDDVRAAAAARFEPGTEVLGIVRGTGGGR